MMSSAATPPWVETHVAGLVFERLWDQGLRMKLKLACFACKEVKWGITVFQLLIPSLKPVSQAGVAVAHGV